MSRNRWADSLGLDKSESENKFIRKATHDKINEFGGLYTHMKSNSIVLMRSDADWAIVGVADTCCEQREGIEC